MDVREVIKKRKVYRSFESVIITKKLIIDLARYAQITASCFNSQLWRFIFVYNLKILERISIKDFVFYSKFRG